MNLGLVLPALRVIQPLFEEDLLWKTINNSRFTKRITGGPVLISFSRLCPSNPGFQGDTLSHYQSLSILQTPLPSKSIRSSYPASESTLVSSKSNALSYVSRFHFQLESTCILEQIVPWEGTLKKKKKKTDSQFVHVFT